MLIIKKLNVNKFSLILLFLVNIQVLYAQDEITGTILDKKSKEVLPYANILIKNGMKGTMTNEDGAFKLQVSTNDTLIISYVSFERVEIPASWFAKNQQYYLIPIKNELPTIEISANIDFVLDLLISARKKMKKMDSFKSKSYFSLKSKIKDIPLELVECYYNAELSSSGFNKLKLKNGRIGLSQMEDNWFVSLSTTDILSSYNILYKKYNQLPINPLQLSRNKINEYYTYQVLVSTKDILKIEFTPKNNQLNLFSSIISIDKDHKQIIEVTLFTKDLKQHPFKAIDKKDKLSKLNLNLSYTYILSPTYTLNKVNFNYTFNYHKNGEDTNIETEGVFIFYDVNEPFDLPYYSTPENLNNDYQKIISQPYNPTFWNTNQTILPSEKHIFFKNFFSENGALLNFDKLTARNPLLQTRVIPWSENRIFLFMLGDTQSIIEVLDLSSKIPINAISEMYDLSAQIYLDRNTINGKAFYTSQTIINTDKSFYYLPPNKNTTCFINLYFDQIEMARRTMIKKLQEKDWRKNQVDSIFYAVESTLKSNLKHYSNKTKQGENETELRKFIEAIKSSLKIDNSTLIEDKDVRFKLNNYTETDLNYIDYYNYGSTLLKLEKYTEAKKVLLKCLELGDKHPWVFYNLGLACLKLDENQNACQYFRKSITLGEKIESKLMNSCEE